MRKFIVLTAACALALAARGAETGVPEIMATTVTVDRAAGDVSAWLRLGTRQAEIAVTMVWSDGTNTALRFVPGKTAAKRQITVQGKRSTESLVLSNGCVECPNLRLFLHVRPNPDGYTGAKQDDLIRQWDSLPPAGEYEFPLAVRPDANGAQYWIDGRYAGRADKTATLQAVAFKAGPGATVRDARQQPLQSAGRYLSLDISRLNRPGAMKDAALSLKADEAAVRGVPFLRAGGDNADVGLAKEMTSGGMDVDPYLARTAFDGMPESLLYSVPLAQYVRAWVLCAAEDDPAKDPVLTARLTRFTSDGRGDAIADTSVELPRDGKDAPGFARVGTVEYPAKNGRKTVSLWLAEIPLKAGAIQDLIFFSKNASYNDGRLADRRYLDFEVLGKLAKARRSAELQHKPDRESTSGVHVFGLTLERTPVEMEVRQNQVGNVFQGDEIPEIRVALRAREA